jgi:outer membrane protein assembly factor BamB
MITRHAGRRATNGLAVAAVVALASGCGLIGGGGDPGDEIEGPHRVPAAAASEASAPRPDGPPSTGVDAASHHWIALSRAWAIERTDEVPHHYGLGTDGSRAFVLRAEMGATFEDPDKEAELMAVDPVSGNKLWEKKLQWVAGTNPVAAEGTVVVATGTGDIGQEVEPAEYVGLDAATGNERWRVKVTSPISSFTEANREAVLSPGVFLDKVFYYVDGGRLAGVDAVTGKELHWVQAKAYRFVAGPVVVADQLTVLGEPTVELDEDARLGRSALPVFDKKLKFVREYLYPKNQEPEMLAVAGDVVVASDGYYMMSGVDHRTAKELWTLPDLKADWIGQPIGGVIPVLHGTNEYEIAGIDAATGKRVWNIGSKGSDLNDRNLGVADGTLFALGHGIEIIDPKQGKVTFTRETNRGGGQVVAAGDRIVVYNQDGISGFM